MYVCVYVYIYIPSEPPSHLPASHPSRTSHCDGQSTVLGSLYI